LPFLLTLKLKIMRTHFIEDVFTHNTDECMSLIQSYGLPRPTNEKDCWDKLNFLITKRGNEVMPIMAQMHPDKDLIIAANTNNDLYLGCDGCEKKSNACGCGSGADGSEYSNCNGDAKCQNCNKNTEKLSGVDTEAAKPVVAEKSATPPKQIDTTQLIFGAVALITVMSVVVIATKK
jgi:hypothetical protein